MFLFRQYENEPNNAIAYDSQRNNVPIYIGIDTLVYLCINSLIIMTTLFYKIPPNLPLPNPESFRDSLAKRGKSLQRKDFYSNELASTMHDRDSGEGIEKSPI
jgi:hypothetical protein